MGRGYTICPNGSDQGEVEEQIKFLKYHSLQNRLRICAFATVMLEKY
jgi:hypothetical protein